MDNLNWDWIRLFLDIAEAGSLSAAARRTQVSQPTLSRQLADFEQHLGQALFERAARGLRLTTTGELLLPVARAMRDARRDLDRIAAGQHDSLIGTVRVTASEMVATFILPAVGAHLRRLHPSLTLEVVATNVVENLLEGQADIAIRHTPPRQHSIVARRLGYASAHAFAHQTYLDGVGGKIDPDRLLDYDFIGHIDSDLILRGFHAAGLPVDRNFFKLRSDDHVVCWQLARAGAGIAFALDAIAEQSPEMVRVLPDGMVPPLPVWLVSHRELRGSARMRAVFALLGELLPSLMQIRQ